MKRVLRIVKEYLQKRRARNEQQKRAVNISSTISLFRVTERRGRLYILCDETAVYKASLHETTEEVINRKNVMQEAACSYKDI